MTEKENCLQFAKEIRNDLFYSLIFLKKVSGVRLGNCKKQQEAKYGKFNYFFRYYEIYSIRYKNN